MIIIIIKNATLFFKCNGKPVRNLLQRIFCDFWTFSLYLEKGPIYRVFVTSTFRRKFYMRHFLYLNINYF